MALVTDLENEAISARQDLADRRSQCPRLCTNLLQKCLKNDVKLSATFKVDTDNNQTAIKPAFEEGELEKLGAMRKVSLSYEKTDKLTNQMNQISAALGFISRNRPSVIKKP